jgi:hypothetical protein
MKMTLTFGWMVRISAASMVPSTLGVLMIGADGMRRPFMKRLELRGTPRLAFASDDAAGTVPRLFLWCHFFFRSVLLSSRRLWPAPMTAPLAAFPPTAPSKYVMTLKRIIRITTPLRRLWDCWFTRRFNSRRSRGMSWIRDPSRGHNNSQTPAWLLGSDQKFQPSRHCLLATPLPMAR